MALARFRRDVVVYATGFVITLPQMREMAHKACTPDFIKKYSNQLVLALRWHVGEHRYEILCDFDANEYFFAVDFFPAVRGRQGSPDLKDEQKQAWYELYGRHTGLQLEDYKQSMMPYPLGGRTAEFLQDLLQEVIVERNLGHLLEPAPPNSTLAELIEIARDRQRHELAQKRERQRNQPAPSAARMHGEP
ncbi:hypothetical protein GGX14DRAFT_565188 [Mycena pura]|uniref:DUF4304 domain-containing protein n=1 Tax=Mycena pura TaxID=153505 RepID=A0AAD6VFJ5_9AGAR|nr:hypothetical protein GGX14DRAFT_565188 [Mycena pura]